jgi:tetratricopeptide (TPR) repeat protein
MTDPRPCCFRWARRTIVLACLAIVLTAAPRALGQAPAAPKPSRSSTANRQERLNDRDRLAKEVEQLKTHGKLLDAIKAVEAMRTIEREVLGETSEDAIGSLEILAKLHQDREDWAEAKKAWSEVLELREKTLGKDHWKVTDARWALADVESLSKMDAAKRRRLAEAEKLDQKVEELFGQGKYSEAMKMAREVATIRKEIQGERHPDHAQSLNNLALLLATQGGYAAARPLYEQALAIYKVALGERHPDYALSLNNLAELFESQGDYAAARPLFE